MRIMRYAPILLGLLACGGGGGGDGSSSGEAAAQYAFALGNATGATFRPLLGVNTGPYPLIESATADLTDEYQRVGVTMVRTHDFAGPLDVTVMYPDPSKDPSLSTSYDFSASDVRFSAIVDGGFEVYFRLGDSAGNSNPPDPGHFDHYAAASVNVLRHYRSGLWSGFTAPIAYVEIWNEPDSSSFWPGLSLWQFNTFYIKIANALRTAYPDLKIGGAGWTQGAVGSSYLANFLDSVKMASAPLDFLSFHLYSNDPDEFAGDAQSYRATLDARGFTAAELHITEWNTNIGSASSEEVLDLRTRARGAALMTAAWMELQKNGVAVSTFYRGGDFAFLEPQLYGLFYPDGTRKKIADAFELWASMSAYTTQLEISLPHGFPLRALAGRDASGAVAILVCNPTSSATTYSVGAAASIREVSDGAAGIRAFESSSVIEIPAYGVQLAILAGAP